MTIRRYDKDPRTPEQRDADARVLQAHEAGELFPRRAVLGEREEVENVFGLGGGELADEPWAGYAYWYDGAPEYASESDLGVHPYEGELRTVIVAGGGYLSPPKDELEADGETWELITSFTSSGEADCWVCGAGGNGKEWWAEEFEKAHGRPPHGADECGLSETTYNDMPGVVYVGDGYEAVYKLVEEDDEEDED